MPKLIAGMQLLPTDPSQYQTIPADEWTVLTYNTVLSDPGGDWIDLAQGMFRPEAAYNPAKVHYFAHLICPDPDARVIQWSLRLCRDPYGEYAGPNTTNTREWAGTPGRQFQGASWSLKVRPDQPLAVQIRVEAVPVEYVEVMTNRGVRMLECPVEPREPVPVQVVASEFKLTYTYPS